MHNGGGRQSHAGVAVTTLQPRSLELDRKTAHWRGGREHWTVGARCAVASERPADLDIFVTVSWLLSCYMSSECPARYATQLSWALVLRDWQTRCCMQYLLILVNVDQL